VILRNLKLYVAFAMGMTAISAAAATAPKAETSFVVQAQEDALGQYGLGVLGQKKAASHAVKSLAREVATNAAKVDFYLKNYAKAHGITPASKPTLRASYQYDEISSISGAAFDRAFARRIYEDTTLATSTYHSYVVSARDPTLKKFAQEQETVLLDIATRAHQLGH
jgi:putative membrane protein